MRPKDRQDAIASFINTHGQATVEELSRDMRASKETIRRDLSIMDSAGIIRKQHGGARSVDFENKGSFENSFSIRMGLNLKEKRAIASKAASLFYDGDVLFIDSGSTTILFAEQLSKRRRLRVITNSLCVAEIRGKSRNEHKIILLGGDYDPDLQENLGPLALHQIKKIHAEHLVLTVGGVHKGGIRDFDIREAEIARAMIENSNFVTVIADSSKFDGGGIFDVAPMSKIGRIITDSRPSLEIEKAIEDSETQLIITS